MIPIGKKFRLQISTFLQRSIFFFQTLYNAFCFPFSKLPLWVCCLKQDTISLLILFQFLCRHFLKTTHTPLNFTHFVTKYHLLKLFFYQETAQVFFFSHFYAAPGFLFLGQMLITRLFTFLNIFSDCQIYIKQKIYLPHAHRSPI